MPLGQRFFAAIYDPITRRAERGQFARRRRYVAGEARGRVLEIGAGTGHNLSYYPEKVELTVVEPNPHMLRRLEAKALRLGRSFTAVPGAAEQLPFPDASFDTVIATLVLCSVGDQTQVLTEMRRVLSPRGVLRFMEHVRSGGAGWFRFQSAITPVWKRVGAGCHPNRDTLAAIRDAGFEIVEVKSFQYGPYPTRPHVTGMARPSTSSHSSGPSSQD